MRTALAQINSTLADFSENKARILKAVCEAAEQDIDLVIFPECAMFGYNPADLLERETLVDEQLKELKALHQSLPKKIGVLVGAVTKNPSKRGRPYFNSVAFLQKGKPAKFFHKELHPVGDIFDDGRYFEKGQIADNVLKFMGKKILVLICEDMWAWPDSKGRSNYRENPVAKLKGQKFDLIVNMSASPFWKGKAKARHHVAAETVRALKAPLVYVNTVGALDEVIYDGGSFVLDNKGKLTARAKYYSEDLLISHDLSPELDETEMIHQALVTGIRDYCSKNGLQKVHLGLSGGIDSAVVACLAVEALGKENVSGYALPGPYSSPDSERLAHELAKNLGIKFESISIQRTYDALISELKVQGLSLVNENLQARIRGTVLMAISNRDGSLLLSTSNKSEYATGYSTLYGDMCGGLAPLGDLTKKEVYDLSRRMPIAQAIIDRPPTAELRPNQKDQDSLPPYDLLDIAVENVVTKAKPAKTETEKWLLKAYFKNEFKRWQAPPILKVAERSFGHGRRYPLTHHGKA